MSLGRQHSFWGSLSPLGGLTGVGLLIMASGRLAWAITVAGSLFWVYGLTAITYASLESVGKKKLLPVNGRGIFITCLAAFFSSIYLLLFWLICPFAAMEVFMLLLLVPLFCASPDFIQQIQSLCESAYIDIFESLSDSVSKAASLAGLLIAFSIIREPLSYCMLSFPGTYQGMVTIMYFKSGAFFPMGIFTASAGSLLLLGYFICLYQYWKGRTGNG
ncbi:hypothetical protein [Treponema sp. R80B11-R83G3]